ncbi:MAG: xanthine dehydrogenase family protein subunit M [Myxococcales bacterium]|nr:xanthine dehydrogenase family protein subunit M [Myxococcales bacterium]
MIPASFDYRAPTSVSEAIAILNEVSGAKLLAGGHSLVPAMRFRLSEPHTLVDLNGIAALRHLEDRGDHLAIGAMCRESALEEHPAVAAHFPLLLDTAKVIADPLVRNHATVGGNLAHSDPANDHPATMLAYNATIVAQGASGQREIPIDSFFTGLFENALGEQEILTEIRVPKPGAGAGGAYSKIERKVGDYAIAAVAVQLTMAGDTISAIRIGLTNVSLVPMRATQAEAALMGQTCTDQSLEAAGSAAAAECDPSADLRGQVDYKRDMVRVLVKRTVRKAVARAQGVSA